VRYYRNDRYDAGLWCDALQDIPSNVLAAMGSILLVNDSVFVTRPFRGIRDALTQNATLDMVGLSYSLKGGFWLER